MRQLPLRLKLALWSALVVGVVLLAVGGFSTCYVYLQRRSSLDLRLAQTAESFLEMFQLPELSRWDKRMVMSTLNSSGNPTSFVEILSRDGTTLYNSDNLSPQQLATLPPGLSYLTIQGLPCRAYCIHGEGFTVCLAANLTEIHKATMDLAVGYLVVMPFLLLSVSLVGQFIASKALKSVHTLTTTAERINARRLNLRLPVPKNQDEIGRLAVVLNDMFDRLDISFQQAIRFSADASHELKTPLTILRASIEDRLANQEVDEETKAFLDDLLEQIAHLVSIIEHLVLLSRLDAGQIKMDVQEHDIGECLGACIEDAQIMAEPYDLTLEKELSSGLIVPADIHRFTQVMLNLLGNAIKYNVPGGKVIVKARQEEGGCAIRVLNTSTARLEENPQRIFDRFYRHADSSGASGHGLGLGLARELARAHGGDITLVRSDGQWTEFLLILPMRRSLRGADLQQP